MNVYDSRGSEKNEITWSVVTANMACVRVKMEFNETVYF